MKREIKFRAWFVNDKVMLYDVQDAYKGHTGEPHRMEAMYALSFGELLSLENNGMNHHVVMQFTGLTDKNGNEIYEGDVCHVDLNFVGKIHVCVFDNVSCSFKWQLIDDVQAADNRKLKGELRTINRFSEINKMDISEIIGNIYQNPELLNPTTNT